MSKVLIISGDIVGSRMAGPAIRCLEMAQRLGTGHAVTLAAPQKPDIRLKGCRVVTFRNQPEADLINRFEAVVMPGSLLCDCAIEIPLVVDLYDPFILSNLHFWEGEASESQRRHFTGDLKRLSAKLQRGDFFLCASEKQRDFWLGMLAALGRITPEQGAEDSSFRRLLDVVPFGIGDPPHAAGVPAIRGKVPGIDEGDFLLVWGGGIWNWFDPETLLEAVAILAPDFPRVKLFFMGVRHPNPLMPLMKRTQQALDLAGRLGLLDRHVFFGDWIPYEQRQHYLLEADVGVSLHFTSLETRFAYRTRLLDYLWAGLPVLTTAGDSLADVIESDGMGITVPERNAPAVAAALRLLIDEPERLQRMAAAVKLRQPKLHWNEALQPLQAYLKAPYRTAPRYEERPIEPVALRENLDVLQTDAEEVVGEIIAGRLVEQRFTARFDHLCKIEVLLATYDRVNQGFLYYRLTDAADHELVFVQGSLSLDSLADNAWVVLRFDPLCYAAQRRFSLLLETPDATPGNAVTIWKSKASRPPNTLLLLDGERATGCLCFKVSYLVLPGSHHPLPPRPGRLRGWRRFIP